MHKRLGCILLAVALLCLAPASAAPGLTDNPVLTQKYIQEEYLPSIAAKAAMNADAKLAAPLTKADELLGTIQNYTSTPSVDNALLRRVMSRIQFKTTTPVSLSLKTGTTVQLGLGGTVQLISGTAGGASLTDATEGKDASGALEMRRKYVSLADLAEVTLTSDATLLVSGGYKVILPYVPKYTELCEALMAMGIINTYALDRVAVRSEMYIVYLTVLGVKQESEAYTGTHPFTDVPDWANPFVAYLYNYNYTAGTGGGKFSPNNTGSVQQMSYILLKALGYADSDGISYATAVSDAVRLGLFTQHEIDVLSADSFMRDALMYMTYYSLFAVYKDSGERVIDRLVQSGFVSLEAAEAAVATVTRIR